MTENIYLRDNIGTNCFNAALYLGSSSNASTVRNVFIMNNSFVSNNQGGQWGTEVALFSNANCTFKQNIAIPRSNQHMVFDLWNTPTVTSWNANYNLFYRFTGNLVNLAPTVGLGSNAVLGDPKFVSTALPYPNYHLTTGSKAINRGDPAFFPAADEFDIDGESRRQAGRVDIGADESPLSASIEGAEERTKPETESASLVVFPNPASDVITVRMNHLDAELLQILDMTGKVMTQHTIENAA